MIKWLKGSDFEQFVRWSFMPKISISKSGVKINDKALEALHVEVKDGYYNLTIGVDTEEGLIAISATHTNDPIKFKEINTKRVSAKNTSRPLVNWLNENKVPFKNYVLEVNEKEEYLYAKYIE